MNYSDWRRSEAVAFRFEIWHILNCNCSDQLETILSGGFAFLYIPSRQVHYQFTWVFESSFNPLERLANDSRLVYASALQLATYANSASFAPCGDFSHRTRHFNIMPVFQGIPPTVEGETAMCNHSGSSPGQFG
jgi:hypothetical protein